MKTHHRTLDQINKGLMHLQSVVLSLQEACQILESSKPFEYEVHIPQNAPGVTPIMVLGQDFLDACYKARRLDLEYNGRSKSSLELFVRSGDTRIAIDPEDAFELLTQPNRVFKFTLDSRILKTDGPMVFKVGGEMPSAWYATSSTPERASVLA
jgi:hypothetical protein